MKKFMNRIIMLCFGFMLSLGINATFNEHSKAHMLNALATDWVNVTSLSDINESDSYILLTNEGSNYFNGQTSNNHYSTTSLGDGEFGPAEVTALGVIKFEKVSENIYKIKLVSPSSSNPIMPYLTASKAGSGGAKLTETDDSGWLLLEDSSDVGFFNAIYQKAFLNSSNENEYAALRSYQGTTSSTTTYTLRTYKNTGVNKLTTSSGNPFKIRKFISGAVQASLSSIEVNDSPLTRYYVGETFDPTNLSITRNYSDGTFDVFEYKNHENEFSFSPDLTTLLTTSHTSIAITYSEKTISLPITIKEGNGVIYDLSKNFDTYTIKESDRWSSTDASHTITNEDIGENIGATLEFKFANKQSSGVGSSYPCIGAKGDVETEALVFTLNETGKKIASIEIVFVTRTNNKYATLSLHKGSGISSTSLQTLTMSGNGGNECSLTIDNLNDTMFTIGYNPKNTSDNVLTGIKLIDITLKDVGIFGTLDHISLSSLPDNLLYHVGEAYSSTGLIVIAYDRTDESNESKDVTSSITSSVANNYTFTDNDVPGIENTITYIENGITKTTSFHITVYAVKNYQLVTSEPTDWSGNYLIVGTDSSSNLGAFNAGLTSIDNEANYKIVSADSSNIIATGQELEWSISKIGTNENGVATYSIKSKTNKYIGSLTTNGNGLLVSDSPLVNTISFDNTDVNNLNKVVITGSNGNKLELNTSGNRFRYYAKETSVKLYKLVQSNYVDEYAITFLKAIKCDATGNTPPSFNIKEGTTYWTWDLLAIEYNLLSTTDKEEFRLGASSSSGTNLQKALFIYDYIILKYGTDSYNDFMNRGIASNYLNEARVLSNSQDEAILVITLVSCISITLIGGYVFIKKRKYD